jgi:hypothetical protein
MSISLAAILAWAKWHDFKRLSKIPLWAISLHIASVGQGVNIETAFLPGC